jgi:DUF1009 family protein
VSIADVQINRIEHKHIDIVISELSVRVGNVFKSYRLVRGRRVVIDGKINHKLRFYPVIGVRKQRVSHKNGRKNES